MAITLQDSHVDGLAAATTHTIDLTGMSTGYAADDLLIVIVSIDYNSASNNFAGIDQSWITMEEHYTDGGSQEAVYYKKAGSSSETSPIVSITGSAELSYVVAAFRGVDTTTPIDISTTASTWGDATDPTAPTITVAAGAVWIAVMGHDRNGVVSMGAGSAALIGYGSNQCHAAMAYEVIPAGGATGTQVFDTDSTDPDGHANSLSLAPAAAGGATPHGVFGLPFHGPFGGPI